MHSKGIHATISVQNLVSLNSKKKACFFFRFNPQLYLNKWVKDKIYIKTFSGTGYPEFMTFS